MISITRRLALSAAIAGTISHHLPARAGAEFRELRKQKLGETSLSMLEAGSGPIIVLVHGALADMGFWWPLVETMAARYTLISYTLDGHFSHKAADKSAGPGKAVFGDYALQRHAGHLVELIETLGPIPVHLVGHDIGANIAMRAASVAPASIASLTLANPSEIGFRFSEADFRDAAKHDAMAMTAIDHHLAKGRTKQALTTFLKQYAGSDNEPIPDWVEVMYAQNAATLPRLLSLYKNTPAIEEGVFERLRMPLHLVSGAATRPSARAVNDVLAERFARSAHTLVPGGYLSPIHNSADFARVMQVFFDRYPFPATSRRT